MILAKKTVILFLSLFLSRYMQGQNAEQYSFTHYRLADGLASNTVRGIVQDATGFMWLSTNSGLQRFDGNKFITFKHEAGNAATLPTDEVVQLYQDHHRLWVCTADNKVGLFDTKTFLYTEVPIRGWKRAKTYIDKIFVEGSNGQLLLHLRTTANLFQFDKKEGAFLPSTAVPFPKNWTVNHLLHDKATGKFFASSDSGFAVYNTTSRTLNYRGHNPGNEPLVAQNAGERFLNYLSIDSRRRVFFEQWPQSETHPVLKLFNLRTGEKGKVNLRAQYGLGYHQIKAVMEQHNGRLWIYGLPFLAEYTGNNTIQFLKKDYNKEKELKFNQVYALVEDRQRNIWICTDNGVYLFNPDAQFFHNYTLTTPKRFAVEGRAQKGVQLRNGEIWIGYRDLGLHRFDAQMHPLPLPAGIVPYQDGKSVWDIHQHSKTGKLWIAMQGGKLIVYDTLSRKAQLLSPPAFEQRAITQITEDKTGNLWFGTQAGNVVKWNVTAANKENGFSLVHKTGVIERMFTDDRGTVWVAAIGEGLLKIDAATNRIIGQFSENSPAGFRLWNNHPHDILQYNDSLLVVASGALNIINISTGKVRHISTRDGLPTNTVQSLAKDPSGRLWLGTMNGVCMTNIGMTSFTGYDESDGLLNDHFNVAGATALHDGRMLFTSVESFLLFDPAETGLRDTVAKALLTDVLLLNTSLRMDSLQKLERLKLDYNQTNLVIEFSALNYDKLNKLDYHYQLTGFDTGWVKSNSRHQAVYTYLPPGPYTFKVKTKNVAGVFSPETILLNLRVYPPFWRSWWFYLLVLFLLATVLYLLYRERIERLVTLHSIRSEIAGHLHQDVSLTLNNINVLSQIAKLKADKDIMRSKELIDEISGKSYNMMLSMDEILWSIDPVNDTMEKTLLRLSEFARTQETNYGISIDLVIHQKVKALRLHMKLRHDFFIVCKEALQSLAQASQYKSITVDIDLVWSKILLKILSVGDEASTETASLLELRENMKRKAAHMHASLTFETGRRDASIILSIPVK